MSTETDLFTGRPLDGIVLASGEAPLFQVGDHIQVNTRSPIGHYRVPIYLRGKVGQVEAVIDPPLLDNEEEGYGRNAGSKLHYYRVAFSMSEVWSGYSGSNHDQLYIEIIETWLQRISR